MAQKMNITATLELSWRKTFAFLTGFLCWCSPPSWFRGRYPHLWMHWWGFSGLALVCPPKGNFCNPVWSVSYWPTELKLMAQWM